MSERPAEIIPGAESVRIDRGRRGACLLLHGWLTSPADFGRLPEALDEAGWDVYAPRLPGHGTRPEALEEVTADDLLGAARSHYRRLRRRYERVVLGGFSMGGTMATVLAGETRPAGLVLVAPFYRVRHHWYYLLPARRWARLLTPLLGYVTRAPFPKQINDRSMADRIVQYDRFPVEAVEALFELRRRAKAVEVERWRMPVLLLYSSGDQVADPAAMRAVFERVPPDSREEVAFTRSNHLLLWDWDRRAAVEAAVEFCGRE